MCDDDGVVVSTYGVFVRTQYNYDRDAASEASALVCTDETKAQQQFKEECDINTIVRNFGLTGEMPQNPRVPLSADFIDTMDYQSSLNRLLEAEAGFMAFPAELRARFQNDPGKFIAFVEDKANEAEARKWGLLKPVVEPVAPLSVRVVADPSEPTKSA